MDKLGEGIRPQEAVVTRRGFLRRAAGVAGAALVGVLMASAKEKKAQAQEVPKNKPADEAPPKPTDGQITDKREIIERIVAENDLIPRDELWERYKIKVLDSPDVTFDFRKTAIGREHLFKSQEKRNGAVKIVLVNGHYIHPDFLTEEQRKELTPAELTALSRDVEKAKAMVRSAFTSEKVVKQKAEEYMQKVKLLDETLSHGIMTQDRHDLLLQVYNEEYRPYLKGPSDEDLLQDLTGMAPPINDKNPNDPEATRLIFLPVKDPPVKIFKAGTEEIKIEPDPYFLRSPRPENSLTDPDDLDVDFKGELYPIRKPTLNTVARHEIKHAAGMGHPAADFEPYNDLVIAKNEARKGNYQGYWGVWRHKEYGIMVGKSEAQQKAA